MHFSIRYIFLIALLENHIVPHVMCLPVITEEYKARSIGPERLGFDCDERGHTVEGRRLVGDFMLGENGVVYMLDDVLIPDRGGNHFKSLTWLSKLTANCFFLNV